MKRRGVVCRISAAGILDMPDDPLQHLSGIDVCAIINRMHLDAELVLSLVIGHVMQKCRQLVDGDARPSLDLAIASASGVRPISEIVLA